METIQLQTPHNVTLEYEQAGAGERILAALIDTLIWFSYLLVFGYLFDKYVYPEIGSFGLRIFIGIIFFFIPFFFYHLFFEIFMNGQSPGKRQRKIKVIRLDGSSPNIGNYLIRWFMGWIEFPIVGLIAIISITLNKKGQRLGDIAAGTVVVKVKPRLKLSDVMAFMDIEDENYKPIYKQVTILTDAEVNSIKHTLHRYRLYTSTHYGVVQIKANEVQEKLGLKQIQQSPVEFLKTVVKDYSHLATSSVG